MSRFPSLPVSLDNSRREGAFGGLVGWLFSARVLLAAVVVIPTMLTFVYYTFIAADRYVSESQFIVRSVKSPRIGGLDAIFRTFGMSASDDDASAVQSYLESRDALRDLEARLPLREMFARRGLDVFTSFPRPIFGDTFESLYKYYLSRVELRKSSHTGLSQLNVSAFRPEDAQLIAKTLLQLSEELINRMNERAQRDAMSVSQGIVERSEKNVLDAQEKLTAFRNRELLVDPTNQSLQVIELIGKLSADLTIASAQLDQTRSTTPSGPAIQALTARVTALQNQINSETAKIAGNKEAMASKISEFERLTMTREFADKQLQSAMATLETAVQDARRQQIYIEQVVAPNLPDQSTEPRRIRLIITVFVFSFTIFAMVWILYVGAKEHAHA